MRAPEGDQIGIGPSGPVDFVHPAEIEGKKRDYIRKYIPHLAIGLQDVLKFSDKERDRTIAELAPAFRAAGVLSVRNALEEVGSTILEPLMKIEVQTPEEYMGDVLGDLSGRRIQVENLGDGPGGVKTIRGKIPIAEMFQYSTSLRSLSQGRATFSMEPSEYSPVPRSLQDVIIKELKERRKS